MSDKSDIPRYGLRKRPANNDVPSHKNVKQKSASLPLPDAHSGVARPLTPKSNIRKLRGSTLNKADTPTRSQKQQQLAPTSSPPPAAPSGLKRPIAPKSDASNLTSSPLTSLHSSSPCQEQLTTKPSIENSAVPHKLTINGRTFTGPLPPNKTTDPSNNAANIPGDHGSYKLFVCADCPIPQKDNKQNEQNSPKDDDPDQNDLHTLCYPTHPCLWSFPPKAREAFANRAHWLQLNKPLDATRRPNGRLPRLLDEDGEPITRGLLEVQRGVDPNRAYDEVVMKRYTAVVKSEECCEMRGLEEGDARLEEHRLGHRVAREEMLGDMGWGFEW